MNIRYLERNNQKWFGGGIDLTPYYISKKDIINYHKKLKTICDKYDDSFTLILRNNVMIIFI